jgi:alcohol dehydrogenase (cytochrome c)
MLMKAAWSRGAVRAALIGFATAAAAGAATAQPSGGAPDQPAPPPSPPGAAAAPPRVTPYPGGGFPSVRNEDAVYRDALARRQAKLDALTPVTDAVLANPPVGDWLIWRRTYQGLGFSPLDQIDKRNVASLTSAWNWSLPVSPNEITPLVHDGVIFIASANRVQALDAVTGDLLWQYTRTLPPAMAGGVNGIVKNLAVYENLLYVPTPDRHMVALDMKTGKVVWDHELVPADVTGLRADGGPLVAKGKVIMGLSSCNNYKGGCFIVGLDAKTGAEAWRFHSIARPGEPGGDTWNGHPLDERYGGSVWTSGSYDPALGLVYYGLGQTYNTGTLLAPRPGQSGLSNNDALYTSSTVALDPETGKLVWHYQHMNRDVWDYDWVFERSLIDLPVGGTTRQLSVTAGKLAIFDAVDRKTGQYVFSQDLGLQDLVTSIDPKTGHKAINPKFEPKPEEDQHEICPHAGGARSWPATAYNPKTKIIYVPLVESCMVFSRTGRDAKAIAEGGSDLRWIVKARPDSDGNIGRVQAINLETRKTVWTRRARAPESAALLATGGGLVFEGSRDRMFRALDEATGKVLWETRLAAQPSSFPITYSVGGKQYVAVVAGGGGAHDITWPQLTPEIDNPAGATTLYVFALPGR